ncbi:MAG: DUF5777 family beta-barrel protein, partial [Cyclobacteriaceae bacterium]
MKHFFAAIVLIFPLCAVAQDDLMKIADQEIQGESIYTEQTFKGTRLINGHSVETRKKGVLDLIIGHRFGRLNSGGYDLFGLDDSQVRLGVDYGITDRLNIGVGRSSFEKTYDGFLKYKLLRQQNSAGRNVPLSIVAFTSIALKTLKSSTSVDEPSVNSRLAYAYQAILARKFTPSFSLQLSPTWVHRNAVLAGQGP